MLEILFWMGLWVIFYAYIGYGAVLWVLVRTQKLWSPQTAPVQKGEPPAATLVVCAYNEEECIRQKIENSLSLDYPPHLLHFCWVTDGSDDLTAEIVRQYPFPPNVQTLHLHQPQRQGKIAAFHRAMSHINTPVVVSTDANTQLNSKALRLLVRHFADPQVGAVAGEKRIAMADKEHAPSAGEGIYWQYESLLKKWDSELWSVVGAAGELFAIRRQCYEAVPPDTIVEDFYLTMRIAQHGWRVRYEPDAWAIENSSASVGEEMKRKVRIAAGGLQAFWRLRALLNPFRYGILCFQYVSHRVLRWTLAPFLLPVLLALNVYLALHGPSIYRWLLGAQAIFYLAALAGWGLERRKTRAKALFVPYYFCMMNLAMYKGLARLLRGRQTVLWEKAKRLAP